jgi:SulP family sulfate permease
MLDRVNEIDSVSVVILRMSQIQVMDATGARVIADIVRTLQQRGITVLVKGVQARHLQLVTKVGVLRVLRHHNHLFDELDDAVEHARSHVKRESSPAERIGAGAGESGTATGTIPEAHSI